MKMKPKSGTKSQVRSIHVTRLRDLEFIIRAKEVTLDVWWNGWKATGGGRTRRRQLSRET